MNVIKWIVTIMILIAFLSSLADCCVKNPVKTRVIDMVIAIMCFIGLTVMKMCWW